MMYGNMFHFPDSNVCYNIVCRYLYNKQAVNDFKSIVKKLKTL